MRVVSLFTPRGLEEPVVWRSAMWVNASAEVINGTVKWSAKNRRRVASLTEKSPHTHSTSSWPTAGIAERSLVITVAAHRLIWPQTSTYPRNAVTITRRKMIIPTSHVADIVYEP